MVELKWYKEINVVEMKWYKRYIMHDNYTVSIIGRKSEPCTKLTSSYTLLSSCTGRTIHHLWFS